ncbi:hypothetical protein ABPG75_012712 [Micractinium tetrahymenae]
MRGRLALKRPSNAGQQDDGKRRASGPSTQPAPQPTGTQPHGDGGGGNWAADFAAEVNQATARPTQQQRQQQPAAGTSSPMAPAQPQAEQLGNAEELDVIPESGSEDEEMAAAPAAGRGSVPAPSPAADDEETRQGLLNASADWRGEGEHAQGVAASMRRRLDAGRLQLEAQRRLLRQKQALAASGEALLAQHCRASWQQPQQERHVGAGAQQAGTRGSEDVEVQSLLAECTAGQWWLRAVVNLRQPLQPGAGGGSSDSTSACSGLVLLAASTDCSLVCNRQRCTLLDSGEGGGSSGGGTSSGTADTSALLELTAALEVVQQQGQQGQRAHRQQDGQLWGQGPSQPAGDAWVDVSLLQEHKPGASGSSLAAAAPPMAAPAAPPPVRLGRVQLRWQDWLQSHNRPPLPPAVQQEPWPHRRALVAASEQLDISCLHNILQQQLGCMPAAEPRGGVAADRGTSNEQAAAKWHVLPGPPAQQPGQQGGNPAAAAAPAAEPPAAAAAVRVTQHGSGFAEVELQAGSPQVLDVMERELGLGLTEAAAAAGAPPGAVRLAPSLLSPQHAQQAAAAADALVTELDASIEWVEALLKQKLAIGSQQRRQRPDALPDCWAGESALPAAVAAAAARLGGTRLLGDLAAGLPQDKIMLRGLVFHGYHGAFPEENKLGQKFVVDATLYTDLSHAGHTDDLSRTVNYAQVYEDIKAIVEGPPAQLIESVAERIAAQLLRGHPSVAAITVGIAKPHVAVSGVLQSLGVEITRRRLAAEL